MANGYSIANNSSITVHSFPSGYAKLDLGSPAILQISCSCSVTLSSIKMLNSMLFCTVEPMQVNVYPITPASFIKHTSHLLTCENALQVYEHGLKHK